VLTFIFGSFYGGFSYRKIKKTKNDPVFLNKMLKNKKMRLFGTVNEK